MLLRAQRATIRMFGHELAENAIINKSVYDTAKEAEAAEQKARARADKKLPF